MSEIFSNFTSQDVERTHEHSGRIDWRINWYKEPICIFCRSTDVVQMTGIFARPDRHRCNRCGVHFTVIRPLTRRLLGIRRLDDGRRILKVQHISEAPKDDCSRLLRGQRKAIEAETDWAGYEHKACTKVDHGLRDSGKDFSARVHKREMKKGAYMLHV